MALDTTALVEGTATAVGFGVVFQAIEDRAPTTQAADLYPAIFAGAGYLGGLALQHYGRFEGGGAFEVGEAMTYASAALLGASGTRYVDHRIQNQAALAEAERNAGNGGNSNGGGSRQSGSRAGASGFVDM